MDPQMIPPTYWRDRLRKARSMGLNTIFPYIFWNMLGPEQGRWIKTDENDIVAFFHIAQEEGLNIVLRPGPHICAEREWGGFPAWLAQIPGMVVRSYNESFLKASKSYIEYLANDLCNLQVTCGGPLLMVQVENEYGSFGNDHNYTAAFMLGPLLDGEYYTWAPDQWGSYNRHNTSEGRPEVVSGEESASISLYMFHGGTNFGFSNGAMWQNRTAVFTSSYDYNSPLDESGRTTDLYFTFRETIQKHVPEGSIPDVPPDLPRIPKTTAKTPLTMAALGQAYGFTLYEHLAATPITGNVQPGDRARDRVLHPPNVSVNLKAGDKLQLLVENLGRVDYYSRGNPYRNYLQDPYKGILGDVKVGGVVLENWDIFYHGTFRTPNHPPANPAELDTFLSLPNAIKGNVWIHGFHLGRCWRVGPQQSLYLPGTVMRAGGEENEVAVLELEPDWMEGGMAAVGLSEREWGNARDKDCPDCI
ncbi:glycoside hydrolase family 35 protein [Zopfia rhizophila CBS 207.26]|uniref:Glycoside hydrolase family 35 protein n=1 Tax=Zopfia rhizophila CBS 207.26 TaxID=1314779 RepID=A0A6A6DGU4_9PEZI|nr:glycoside hydrolase family 35 protein [Zopfia rhizophila CBS 207.26]